MVDDDDAGSVEPRDVAIRLVHSQDRPAPGDPVAFAEPPQKASERALVESARAGDADAFGDLVERRSAGVLAFLRRMLGNAEDARDVAQLTFVKAWENLHRYDPSWAFSTWLFRIAGNLAIDSLRARRSRERTASESFRLVRSGPQSDSSGGPAGLSRGEVRRVFDACAEALSEKQRLAFVLRELEEKETGEIAEILGCRESTVRNHLFQARKVLQKEIARRFPEYLPGAARRAAGPTDGGTP